jgi:hypothetical protein
MKIAILGWGSLLWDECQSFDKQHFPWTYDGPELKLEFSRISSTRNGALTLVIDNHQGVDNEDLLPTTTVAWCLSKRTTLEDAVCDLRCREGTIIKNIGQPSNYTPGIAAWAKAKSIDAVIWTALESNFQKEMSKGFSVNNAIEYLRALPPNGKAKAAEYVWRAPSFVKTRLRDALQGAPWF